MEASLLSTAMLSIVAIGFLVCSWGVLNWVWLRPKRLERLLRQQGFLGTPYRLLIGDMKENHQMTKRAESKPTSLTDNIAPHVIPFIHQTVQKYGKNCYTWLGPRPRVVISEMDLVRDIFSKFNDFQKPSTNPLVRLLLVGLVSKEGKTWAKHRRIINPAFNLDRLKHMIPTFYESCNDMIKEWKEMASEKVSVELDVRPHLINLTCDMIARTSFGSCYEEGRRIFQLLHELGSITVQAAQSVYIPGWRYMPTKTNKMMKAVNEKIRVSLQAVINIREKAMKAGEIVANNDLLGILIESNFKEIREHGDAKNVGLSSDEIIDECKLFYIAGHESSSNLLIWTMVLLAKYPDWQARAREEVLNVFSDKKPDLDTLSRLTIITMILYEVLRLYPPIPTLERAVHKETKLGSTILPGGIHVLVPVILLHHDRELWGEDASEFRPDRFAEGVAKATKNQMSFFPFGWGPRGCIGQNYALTEAKLIIAMILQNFYFELSPTYTHAPCVVMALQPNPNFGAHIILHKLQH
ncbi:hypothetical protein SLE2022_312490 [Rubroshorea leprosula]